MSKKKEPKVKERINWRKEASLLPGYIIVLVWIIFTAAFLLWILGASFPHPGKFSPDQYSNLRAAFILRTM